MGVSRAVLVACAGAAVLLAGCGTADEGESTVSSTTSVSVTSESSSVGSTPGSPLSSEPSAVDPSAGATESAAAAPSSAPSVSAPVTDTGGAVPGSSAAAAEPPGTTAVPTITAPPGTFPDREEIEAQGVATNPLCEVLSTDEVTALLGVAVRPATDAAAGTGCLWSAESSTDSFLQLQLVGDPTRYAPPAGAEQLTGIGDVAAVAVAADGVWTAQAQNPDGTFAVQLAGPTASRDGAVEGLRRLLERY